MTMRTHNCRDMPARGEVNGMTLYDWWQCTCGVCCRLGYCEECGLTMEQAKPWEDEPITEERLREAEKSVVSMVRGLRRSRLERERRAHSDGWEAVAWALWLLLTGILLLPWLATHA